MNLNLEEIIGKDLKTISLPGEKDKSGGSANNSSKRREGGEEDESGEYASVQIEIDKVFLLAEDRANEAISVYSTSVVLRHLEVECSLRQAIMFERCLLLRQCPNDYLLRIIEYVMRAVSVPGLNPLQQIECILECAMIFYRLRLTRKYSLFLYIASLMTADSGNYETADHLLIQACKQLGCGDSLGLNNNYHDITKDFYRFIDNYRKGKENDQEKEPNEDDELSRLYDNASHMISIPWQSIQSSLFTNGVLLAEETENTLICARYLSNLLTIISQQEWKHAIERDRMFSKYNRKHLGLEKFVRRRPQQPVSGTVNVANNVLNSPVPPSNSASSVSASSTLTEETLKRLGGNNSVHIGAASVQGGTIGRDREGTIVNGQRTNRTSSVTQQDVAMSQRETMTVSKARSVISEAHYNVSTRESTTTTTTTHVRRKSFNPLATTNGTRDSVGVLFAEDNITNNNSVNMRIPSYSTSTATDEFFTSQTLNEFTQAAESVLKQGLRNLSVPKLPNKIAEFVEKGLGNHGGVGSGGGYGGGDNSGMIGSPDHVLSPSRRRLQSSNSPYHHQQHQHGGMIVRKKSTDRALRNFLFENSGLEVAGNNPSNTTNTTNTTGMIGDGNTPTNTGSSAGILSSTSGIVVDDTSNGNNSNMMNSNNTISSTIGTQANINNNNTTTTSNTTSSSNTLSPGSSSNSNSTTNALTSTASIQHYHWIEIEQARDILQSVASHLTPQHSPIDQQESIFTMLYHVAHKMQVNTPIQCNLPIFVASVTPALLSHPMRPIRNKGMTKTWEVLISRVKDCRDDVLIRQQERMRQQRRLRALSELSQGGGSLTGDIDNLTLGDGVDSDTGSLSPTGTRTPSSLPPSSNDNLTTKSAFFYDPFAVKRDKLKQSNQKEEVLWSLPLSLSSTITFSFIAIFMNPLSIPITLTRIQPIITGIEHVIYPISVEIPSKSEYFLVSLPIKILSYGKIKINYLKVSIGFMEYVIPIDEDGIAYCPWTSPYSSTLTLSSDVISKKEKPSSATTAAGMTKQERDKEREWQIKACQQLITSRVCNSIMTNEVTVDDWYYAFECKLSWDKSPIVTSVATSGSSTSSSTTSSTTSSANTANAANSVITVSSPTAALGESDGNGAISSKIELFPGERRKESLYLSFPTLSLPHPDGSSNSSDSSTEREAVFDYKVTITEIVPSLSSTMTASASGKGGTTPITPIGVNSGTNKKVSYVLKDYDLLPSTLSPSTPVSSNTVTSSDVRVIELLSTTSTPCNHSTSMRELSFLLCNHNITGNHNSNSKGVKEIEIEIEVICIDPIIANLISTLLHVEREGENIEEREKTFLSLSNTFLTSTSPLFTKYREGIVFTRKLSLSLSLHCLPGATMRLVRLLQPFTHEQLRHQCALVSHALRSPYDVRYLLNGPNVDSEIFPSSPSTRRAKRDRDMPIVRHLSTSKPLFLLKVRIYQHTMS